MSFSFFTVNHHRSAGAFTLLEMIITMAIFLLLSAAVFGIVLGVLQSSSTLQDNQNRRDQSVALKAFLKKEFEELPAQGNLISYRRGNGEGLVQNGIILGHDQMLIAIDAKVQANGYYTLRMASYDPGAISGNFSGGPVDAFSRAVSEDDPSIAWTPLMKDVQTIHWQFQDLNIAHWVEQWSTASGKPGMIELSMEQAGDLQPVVMDFWLPKLDSVVLALPQAGATTNAAPAIHAR